MRRLFFCLLVGAGRVFAEEPVSSPARLSAECVMVTLPQKTALALLPALMDAGKIDEAYATLQTMIGRGEATLIADLLINGVTGKKLSATSGEEYRYPTEYAPAPEFPKEMPKGLEAEALKKWSEKGVTPTAFETRNLGVTFELEPTVAPDGRRLAADVNLRYVRFLRLLKYDTGVTPNGEHLQLTQPVFSDLTNNCSIESASGQRLLLGVHKLADQENVMALFLLRLELRRD